MNIYQEIQVNQSYHKITFYIGAIDKIVPFNRDMTTAYFCPECSERDYYNGKCFKEPIADCKLCNHLYKLEEMLVDGFYVNDLDYIAYLQTGIRVPVTKEIYDAFTNELETKGWSFEMKPIILSNLNYED